MILFRKLSITGLVVGTFFTALSLTPSLLPREDVLQGITTGLSFTVGYALGVLIIWLWHFFELPDISPRILKYLKYTTIGICIITMILFLWQAVGWQNSLRALMDIEETASIRPVLITIVAGVIFLTLLGFARLFHLTFRTITLRLQQYVPPRVSIVSGLLASFFIFWAIIDGVFFTAVLRTADSTYHYIDSRTHPEFEQPYDSLRSGSEQSLVLWEDMGMRGRQYLNSGPTREDIKVFTDQPVKSPIRVYAGIQSEESLEARAELALAELKRVNAFDRSVLLLITPTGSGWVDPKAIDPLEYLFRGDIASVAVQYSYLPSFLTIAFENEFGTELSRILFRKIYDYWSDLPENERPYLYLHGLSLGAQISDRSFDLFDIIEDPFNGVLWSGPPFRMSTWQRVTEQRDPRSPAWLPKFRDGEVVRFANQDGGLKNAASEWGDFRIAFLQYASDPVTFFDPRYATRQPEWLQSPRGPDVTEYLRWYPFVTMLQLFTDMSAGTAPDGYGHQYAAEHYFDSWLALTEPSGWSDDELSNLRQMLKSIEEW